MVYNKKEIITGKWHIIEQPARKAGLFLVIFRINGCASPFIIHKSELLHDVPRRSQ
jgi:hypothetical protein